MQFRLGIPLTLLALFFQACGFPPASAPQPPVSTATRPAQTSIPPQPASSPTPRAPAPLCVHPQEAAGLDAGSFADYPEGVLAFLNAGGRAEELDARLYAAGIANQPLSVGNADMTGNGRYDIVVSIFDPDSSNQPPGGILLIYVCESGQYRLAHRQASLRGSGAPGIRYLQDLNGDGDAELLASSPTCGAHTCFEDVQVLSWNGVAFENILAGTTADIPFPDVRISDPQNDGIYRIEVSGSGFGSLGAGPARDLTRIWSWDDSEEAWREAAEIQEPSNYRIHVLHDADAAARRGDYREALLLYGRVIQDAGLEDWVDPEAEQANLVAYALYKTAIIHTLQGNEDFAKSTLEQLRASYPGVSAQYSYVEMAAAFQKAYRETGLEGGCAAAREYAATHADEVLAPLGPQNFGYGNPEFAPEDVCPWE